MCVEGEEASEEAREGRTYIIPAQHTNDFPTAVQLDEEALVEVLDVKIWLAGWFDSEW